MIGGIGSTLFLDSAKCYHYGSRSSRDRYAFTAAFTTSAPCGTRLSPLRRHGQAMFDVLKQSKPQIPESLLRSVLL